MSELPENIWTWTFVSAKQNEFMTGGWHDEPEPHPTGKETRYIRYDKHTGYLADIKAAFGEACDRIAELGAALRATEGGVVAMNQPAEKAMREIDKATIAELEVNINLKADWIERTINDMAVDSERNADLNLAGWIERRKSDVGPYADHIIKSVRIYEVEIERLRKALKESET